MKKTREEPRDAFAARRAARQKRIRKRRLIVFFTFFIIFMLAAGVILSLTVLFPVTTVWVSGSDIYTAEQVAEASGITTEDNIFRVSEKDITERLRLALPYIDTVRLERSLPGKIKLYITDAAEYACYSAADGYFVISARGFVLNRCDAPPAGLLLVEGGGVTCEPGKEIAYADSKTQVLIKQITDNLSEKGIRGDVINISDRLAISAKVEGRFLVNFGTSTDIDRKIAHLSGMIKKIEADKTGKINLSMWSPERTEGSFVVGAIE